MKNKGIISLLAILALVLGVFAYFLSTGYLKSDKSIDRELSKVENVSTSDEVADIETDLNATDLNNIDAEMNQIQSELDAAVQNSQ